MAKNNNRKSAFLIARITEKEKTELLAYAKNKKMKLSEVVRDMIQRYLDLYGV